MESSILSSSHLKDLRIVHRTILEEPKSKKPIQEDEPHPEASCKHNITPQEFPWPPRSYPCGFCKKQFRSAQALGGHMNVHRRERAKLRPSSPADSAHHYNAIFNLNITSDYLKPIIISSPCSSLSSASTAQMKKWDVTPGGSSSSESSKHLKVSNLSRIKGGKSDGGCRSWKKGKNMGSMDMEISSKDVDLELRLGY